jgi:serine protease
MKNKFYCIFSVVFTTLLLTGLIFKSETIANNQYSQVSVNPSDILVQFTDSKGVLYFKELQPYWLLSIEPVIENYHIHKVSIKSNSIDLKTAMNYLRSLTYVSLVQEDHKIEKRSTVPNDTLLSNQWSWDLMQAFEAWSITTGGVTVQDDTIVIAIIDDGMDVKHEDFQGNVWVNRFEIPGDSIDNDSNGYIDDYWGWNTYREDDSILDPIELGRHGMPMAGIIGAVGNNTTGIAGLNWNIKLMIVVGGPAESNALKAFNYVLTQKKRYLETNGAGGAYVVATNGSWGVDRRFPQEAPLWCAFYDTLGKYGIINMAATSNSNINVDLEGDLPTTCPSDYMIAVTNTTKLDQKYVFAGYGKENIDLGAPGHESYTTASTYDGSGRLYKSIGGTSAAAPHVTAIAGLLYAAACDSFITYSKEYPDSAAWLIRYLILNGTDSFEGLSQYVATSGRANAYKPLLLMDDWCQGKLNVNVPSVSENDLFNQLMLYPNPGKGTFEISGVMANTSVKVFDAKGSLISNERVSETGIYKFTSKHLAQGIYFVHVYNQDNTLAGLFKWVSVD